MQDRDRHHLRINIEVRLRMLDTGQTPFTYSHRSPFTYARQGQTPEARWDGVGSQQWPATPISG